MSFDEDIKIFNRSKPLASSDSGPMADDLKRQVVSGNMQRARDLGKDIALSFRRAAAKDELLGIAESVGVEQDRAIKDQAILLSVFTAEYCIKRHVANQSLVAAAVAELYDNLLEDTPLLYQDLLRSPAFTFYYMNTDDEADPDQIGKTFAMLCGSPRDVKLATYGAQVFVKAQETYEAFIRDAGIME